jgi:hypothetical protein
MYINFDKQWLGLHTYILGYCSANSSGHPGTYVVILKIFSPKNLAKILAFFAQTTASFAEIRS